MLPNNTQDKKENLIPLIFIISIVSISVLFFVFYLLNIYKSEIPVGDIHAYYGAMGDFIGGSINPLLSFITIFLLLITLRQNQKVIIQGQEINNQNKRVIELNINELKISNIQLESSKEALHDNAKTSKVTFHMNMIDKLETQFNVILNEPTFHSECTIKKLSINELITVVERPANTTNDFQYEEYEAYFGEKLEQLSMFKEDLKPEDNRSSYRSLRKLIQIYHAYLEAIIVIVGEYESLASHFYHHDITTTHWKIINIYNKTDDIAIFAEIENQIQKTKTFLHPLLGDTYY